MDAFSIYVLCIKYLIRERYSINRGSNLYTETLVRILVKSLCATNSLNNVLQLSTNGSKIQVNSNVTHVHMNVITHTEVIVLWCSVYFILEHNVHLFSSYGYPSEGGHAYNSILTNAVSDLTNTSYSIGYSYQ